MIAAWVIRGFSGESIIYKNLADSKCAVNVKTIGLKYV